MICVHHDPHTAQRCQQPATHHLYDEAGQVIPGGRYCQEHAQEILQEYAAKLNVAWQWAEIDNFGNPTEEPTVPKDKLPIR